MSLLPSSTEPPVGGMDAISPDVVDGAAIWNTLDDEQRKAIGAAAIELAAAGSAWDQAVLADPDGLLPSSRASEASLNAAEQQFDQVVGEWSLEGLFIDGLARQMLPSCLGAVCRRCGCSQNDACAEGCGWAEDDLCTSCVGPSLKIPKSA